MHRAAARATARGWLTLRETSLVVWYIHANAPEPPLKISSRMHRPTLRMTAGSGRAAAGA